MEYNKYGDIKLGELSEHEIYLILDFIKIKYNDGYKLYLKKIKKEDDDTKHTYYLSVPIRIGALYDNLDPIIYIHPEVTEIPFYFIDLYAPGSIQCITYAAENKFISNEEVEGCLFEPDFPVPNCLYEILPYIIHNSEEDEMIYIKKMLGFCELVSTTG